MIGADLAIWLLEVNASPDMSHSTATTGTANDRFNINHPNINCAPLAQLVPAVSEDLAKILVDRQADKKADVGYVCAMDISTYFLPSCFMLADGLFCYPKENQ
jgi:hypothetical protein